MAGGALNQRAQAVQIWLSSAPEQAGALSLNPISFFSGLAANKRSKAIECPQEGIVSSLWNLVSGIQPNEMITSIAFEPSSSGSSSVAMALLVTDFDSPLLSKVNFYTSPSDSDNAHLNYRCSITFKQIAEKVR